MSNDINLLLYRYSVIPLKNAFAVKKFHLALVLDCGIMFNCGFDCEKSVGFVEVNRDGRFENIS